MNAKELVFLEKEIERLSWLKKRMSEELNAEHGDYLRGYAYLKGSMSVWLKKLEKAIKELKSLLDE